MVLHLPSNVSVQNETTEFLIKDLAKIVSEYVDNDELIEESENECLSEMSFQTNYICSYFVRRNPLDIYYAYKQTKSLCKLALNDYHSLKFIKNPTKRLCLEFVKKDANAIQYVHNQTKEMCLIAVKKKPSTIQYVHNQTEEMCLIAVKRYPLLLQFVRKQTEEMCLISVRHKGYNIEFVDKKTKKICLAAIKSDWRILEKVANQTKEMYLCAYQKEPKSVNMIKNQKHMYEFVLEHPDAFKSVNHPSLRLCLDVLKIDGMLLKYISYQNIEMCEIAVAQNKKAILFCKFKPN